MSTQPTQIDVDFAEAGRLRNAILGQLDTLREADPIDWSDASQAWMITHHADVDDALQGKFPLSLKRVELIMFSALTSAEQAELPVLRKYLRPFVQERVRALMQHLERQPAIEFNEEIARPLPGSLILKLLGIPQDMIVEALGVPFADMAAKKTAERAMLEMTELFTSVIAERRRAPLQDDLVSTMLAATEGGDRLSLDEMIGAMHLVLIAGHDTTSSTLTLGVATLAQHPELWRYMHQHPEKILESCLELMRHEAMSTSKPRVAAADFAWHGKQVRKGQFVWLMMAAANRDPRVFADPGRLDPTRVNDKSMVFAPGLHHCIGHQLAKMQVTEFFRELVRRFAGVELLDPELKFMPQIVFRGVYHLNARLQPRGAVN